MKKAPTKNKKKAPKKIPGYIEGGTTLAYQTGDPDYFKKNYKAPEKKNTFGTVAGDIGRLTVKNVASIAGLEDAVDVNYKSKFGEKAEEVREKVLEPIQRAAMTGVLTAVGSPALGAAYATGVNAVDKNVKSKEEKEAQRIQDEESMYYNDPELVRKKGGGVNFKRKKPQHKNLGGKIIGPGTGTSDSIDANIQDGSFVVPEENAGIAETVMAKYLGGSTGKAKLNQKGGGEVKVSNGEFMYTPEESSYLKKMGVNINALAPNQEKDTQSFAKGGSKKKQNEYEKLLLDLKPDDPTKEKPGDDGGNEEDSLSALRPDDPTRYRAEDDDVVIPAKKEAVIEGNKPSQKRKPFNPDMSKIGAEDVLAFGQMGIGITQLFKDGKRPVDTLDPDFLAATKKAKDEAAYGFNPYEKLLGEKGIEGNRRSVTDLSADLSGGNFATAMSNIRAAQGVASSSMTELASADSNLRLQKQRYADQLVAKKAEMRRRLFQDKLSAFEQNQLAGADLLSAGIENYFTNKRNKEANEFEKEIAKASEVKWDKYIETMSAQNKQLPSNWHAPMALPE